jgi:hypothetical protein
LPRGIARCACASRLFSCIARVEVRVFDVKQVLLIALLCVVLDLTHINELGTFIERNVLKPVARMALSRTTYTVRMFPTATTRSMKNGRKQSSNQTTLNRTSGFL